MNWRAIFALVRKDLKIVSRSRNTLVPLIIVPLIFIVVLPGVVILTSSSANGVTEFQTDMNLFFNNMPEGIRQEMAQYEPGAQQIIYLAAAYLFAPMFLIVPLMVSSVIGADSFAGEKERKTLEGLLYTPITDLELYAAKLLVAWIPAALVSVIGCIAYSLVIDLAAWNIMGRIFMPTLGLIVQAVWLAPAAAGLGLGAMVLVSSRVKSVQEATQTGSMIVLPVVVVIVSQFAGLVYFSVGFVLIAGLILWLIDLALLWFGARIFQRGEIMAKL